MAYTTSMTTAQTHTFSLSVFVPFYNEEKNIRKVVENIDAALKTHPRIEKYEIIMVDDGSTDATATIARELEVQFPMSRLVSHPTNRGYGGAVITGIKNSRYDYIFFMDGDNQFDIHKINNLFDHIPEYAVVIGYRKHRQDLLHRKINAKLWNMLVRVVYDLKVRDIDCAFKIFKRDVVASLPLVSTGAMISAEILIRLKRNNVRMKETPVIHLPRLEGKSTGAGLSVIFRAFREFFALHSKI